jgi:vancomycin resistance protein YoaR
VTRARDDEERVSASARTWRRGIAASVVIATVGAGAAIASARDGLPPEAALEGVSLAGAREGEAWAATRRLADAWLDTPVTLVIGDVLVSRSRRALGGSVDVAATQAALAAGEGEVRLHTGLDTARANEAIAALRAVHERTPTVARIEPSGRAVPARTGLAISSLAALEVLRTAMISGEPVVTLPVRELAVPEEATVPIAQAVYTHTLATHVTRYAQSEAQWGRMRNIVNAAAAIDGAVLPPHGELSFNDVVGPRTIERGYRPADEVVDGRLVDGIGGGVCQVAATLHAAAFLAGFDVVEHHPHTRGSSYIDLGLDAAVSWPSVDLRLRNPFPFPVRVRAQAAAGQLTVSLLGAAAAPEVTWSATVVERIARGAEQAAPAAAALAPPRPDEGVDGLVVRRERSVRAAGRTRREIDVLRYPAVPALVVGEEGAP